MCFQFTRETEGSLGSWAGGALWGGQVGAELGFAPQFLHPDLSKSLCFLCRALMPLHTELVPREKQGPLRVAGLRILVG